MLMNYVVLQSLKTFTSHREHSISDLPVRDTWSKLNPLSDRIIKVLKSMYYENHMEEAVVELHKHCRCVLLLPAERI